MIASGVPRSHAGLTASRRPWSGQAGWHRAAWGVLGWIETIVKLAAIAVAVGHWSLVYAMGGATWPHAAVSWFTGLMAAGDVVKLAYFLQTGARVRSLTRAVPIVMTPHSREPMPSRLRWPDPVSRGVTVYACIDAANG